MPHISIKHLPIELDEAVHSVAATGRGARRPR
jgi:hypothetical protein